ncbi:MAG: hypothetical protein C0483_09760 [Pirellula sp.]|nr:hypothetical protein [Pirellula sp.]
MPVPKRRKPPQYQLSRRPRRPAPSKIVRGVNPRSAPIRFLALKLRLRHVRRVMNLALPISKNPLVSRVPPSARADANSTTSATRSKKNKTFCNANVIRPATNRPGIAPRAPKAIAVRKKSNNVADVVGAEAAAVVAVVPATASVRKAIALRAIPLDRTPAARRRRVATLQTKVIRSSWKSMITATSMPTIIRKPMPRLFTMRAQSR